MKRFIYSLLIASSLLIPTLNLVAVAPASAVDIFSPICSGTNDTKTNASATDVCKDKASSQANKQNPLIHIISIVISILAFVIGVASVIMIVISGMRMILAQGDPQSIANARGAIIYALVGIAIAVLAGSIVALVLNNL